jgi:tetratricopeptide (TPR) repeat protein
MTHVEMQAHFVGHFLGYDFGDSPHIAPAKDDPQQIWDRAQTYIAEYFQAASERSPALILFEDVHWADDGSLDVIARLGLALDGYPVLLLCATRPGLYERRPHWFEGRSFHRRLDLHPLSKRDSRQLVEEVLQKVDQVPDSLRELVVSNAEGNPFYLEELIKMLIEDGVIVKGEERWRVQIDRLPAIQVPSTLTGVLQARLDGLPEEQRIVLQQASVVGRVFWDAVIAHLNRRSTGGLAEEMVSDGLAALREREMVYRRDLSAFAGAAEHIFKHTLLREVAYETVLKRARRAYHALVAEWITEHSGEQAGQIPQIIAYHLEQAGKKKEALDYLTLAGEQAAASYANEEAIDHYRHALMLAEQLDAGREEIINLYSKLGRVLEIHNQYEEALSNYERMEHSARDRNDRAMLLAALMGRLTLHATLSPMYDPVLAEELLEKTLVLVRELGDQEAESKILWNGVNLFRLTNRLSQATNYGEDSLAIARRLNMRDQLAFTLNDLAHCYHELGKTVKAKQAYQEAGAIWREQGNMPMLADSLSSLVYVYRTTGEYDEAVMASDEAHDICQAIGNLRGQAYSRFVVGYVFWELGYPDQALDSMEEGTRLGELADFSGINLFTLADMATVYGGLGDASNGLRMARQALAITDAEMPRWQSFPLGVLVELHLIEGDLIEAEAALERIQGDALPEENAVFGIASILTRSRFALGTGDYEQTILLANELLARSIEYGMGAYTPEALYLIGQAHAALGEREAARERLIEARSAAEAIRSQRMLWPILFSLSQLEDDPAEARRLRQQAGEIIHTIAGNINRPNLRETFLNQPRVQAVLETLDD